MNFGRLVGAAVAATVVDMIYGFVVYGMLLTTQFAAYPGVYRSANDTSHMPVLILGVFIGMLAATWIYAKGYEGGSGTQEGMRFGAAVGVFVVGYMALVNFAMTNIGMGLTVSMAVAGLIEWLIVGTVIGLVYKAAQPVRRAAAV